MDKLTHIEKETPNGSQLNLDALYKIAPSCFTEAKGDDGEIHHVVDFNKLRLLLGDNAVEDAPEVYDFTWVGKRAALKDAAEPISKTLRPCKEESVDWDTTQNLYIEGNNLEVLKLLQNSYMGKVKMIYIDPPYNTGNDFVYHDDFTQSAEEYDEHNLDDAGNRYRKNTDSNGRFHSDWCSMIYARLMVARSLLAEDGVIFISIDDNEQKSLSYICDEIFGPSNFIATIVRNTNSTKNQSLFISVSHEYCLVYAKSIETLKIKHAENKWSVPKNNVKDYIQKVQQLKNEGVPTEEITEELKTLTKYPRFIDFTNYWYFDERGLYMKDNLGGVTNGSKVPLLNPLTGKYDEIPPGGFRYSPEKLTQLAAEGRIHFHQDGSLPRLKRYLSENLSQRPKSIMSDDQRPDNALMEEFNTPFDNPKQLSFMNRIVSIVDNDSIVLDFFSGSATTAHAVMQLNAEDGGNRKFIMVQLPEETAEYSEAYKAGYKNICEIGKERIRRAGKKIKAENLLTTQNLDLGFRVFKCADSNYKEKLAKAPKDYNQTSLDEYIDNIKEDRNDLDLLFDCMLRWGIELSLPLQSVEVGGCTIHNVNDGDLVACLKGTVTESVIDAIAEMHPVRVVFRDNSFTEAAQKMNLFELFKQKCGWSDEEVRNNVRVI